MSAVKRRAARAATQVCPGEADTIKINAQCRELMMGATDLEVWNAMIERVSDVTWGRVLGIELPQLSNFWR